MQRSRIVREDLSSIVERLGSTLDKLEDSSLVVTGAGGMLARYLVETVTWANRHRFRKPCSVTAVVRGPMEEIPGVKILVQDARQAATSIAEADYLVLAATKGAPNHYLAEPVETMQLNGSGLDDWLSLASILRSRAVLYFSSGEIYGTPEDDFVPTPETYAGRIDPVSPRSVYAESKRYGEALCLAYHRASGLPVKIVRPFQVFGPGLRTSDGRALAAFLNAAASGQAMELSSSGSARRTFLYLADATVAFFKVLLDAPPGSVYNVGSPAPEISILDLARLVQATVAPAVEIVVKGDNASGAPGRTCPDISRLRQDLSFEPRYGLEDLIRRTYEWMEEAAC